MDTVDTLKAARKLIEDPSRWTQGAWAKDRNGVQAFSDADAVCWCAWGALVAQCKGSRQAELALVADLPDGNLIRFNDTHTHAEVLALFDKAILAASPSPKEKADMSDTRKAPETVCKNCDKPIRLTGFDMDAIADYIHIDGFFACHGSKPRPDPLTYAEPAELPASEKGL